MGSPSFYKFSCELCTSDSNCHPIQPVLANLPIPYKLHIDNRTLAKKEMEWHET